jgi:hypothetical protein
MYCNGFLLTRRLAIRRAALVHTSSSVTKALSCLSLAQLTPIRYEGVLTDSHHLQVVILSPVNKPRRKRINRARIGLVHQRDMPIAAGARLRKLLLALLRALVIPVAAVDVVGYDAVAQRLHGREYIAARCEVGWAHVRWLYTDDVDEGLLEARHLCGEVIGGKGAKVGGVAPGVRGDLVAGFICVEDGGLLVVDAACVG